MKWLGWITEFLKWLADLGSSPVAAQAKETGRLEERLKQEEANDALIETATAARDRTDVDSVSDDPFNRDTHPQP